MIEAAVAPAAPVVVGEEAAAGRGERGKHPFSALGTPWGVGAGVGVRGEEGAASTPPTDPTAVVVRSRLSEAARDVARAVTTTAATDTDTRNKQRKRRAKGRVRKVDKVKPGEPKLNSTVVAAGGAPAAS